MDDDDFLVVNTIPARVAAGDHSTAEAALMSLPRIHLNTVTIKDASIEDKFALAARCGFGGLEMWMNEVAPHVLTPADVAEGAARFGWQSGSTGQDLSCIAGLATRHLLCVDGLLPGTDVLMRWAGRLDAGLVDALAETIRLCAALDARYVVLPALAEQGTLATVAANLREIAMLAQEHGVRLGLEPMGHVEYLNTVDAARRVLDLTRSEETCGIILDSFHFFRARQDLGALACLPRDQIVAVQINDAVAMPLDQLYGNRHRDYPGAGIFDVAGFCDAVMQCGYDGPFTVEVMNPSIWSTPAHDVCRQAFAASVAVLSAATGRSPPLEAMNGA